MKNKLYNPASVDLTIDFKLDSKLKDKWIKALTNRKFKQGIHYLKSYVEDKRKVRHCCLGVLGELCNIPTQYINNQFNAKHYTFDGNEGFLKSDIIPKHIQDKLSEMNDDGVKFSKIAQWIERNL